MVHEFEPDSVHGPYIVESLIARGGMGNVYLALDSRLDRRVALKLLGEHWVDRRDSRERFMRESRLAASLDHPHILPIFEAGELDGRPFLAMRYVDGPSLADIVRAGPLEPERAIALIAQVASALDAAHGAGLVHRDVKPANILVDSTSTGEHAYLADFGLSKAVVEAADVTRAGELVGTVDYVAPEQVEGRTIDHRVDIYSLACVLYELLTGSPPFRRETPVATLFAHVQSPRPAVTDMNPELPAPLDDVVRRGMAQHPDDRFATAGELARAADMALGGATLLADSHDVDALRSANAHDQPTVVMAVPESRDHAPAAPPTQIVPTLVPEPPPAPAPPPEPSGALGPPVAGAAPSRRRRLDLATPVLVMAAVALIALSGIIALRALGSSSGDAAAAPSDAPPGGSAAAATIAAGETVAGVSAVCDRQQLAAPTSGRWRLWRTEYGQRSGFDYLRLRLRREGDHPQAATAVVEVVPRQAASDVYGVEAPGDSGQVLVVAFDGPVNIGAGWDASPRYGALKEFRVARGRGGQVVAVAAISDFDCYAISGGGWSGGQGGSDADLTLEVLK